MTTTQQDADHHPDPDHRRVLDLLRIYAEHPLDDGDAVLALDGVVCLEMPGLAVEWASGGRAALVGVLSQTAQRVVLAIARPGGELLASDYQLWRELHADLRDTDVQLRPLRALPAA